MLATVFFVIAVICHLLAAFGVAARVSWTELAWASFTLGVALLSYGGGR